MDNFDKFKKQILKDYDEIKKESGVFAEGRKYQLEQTIALLLQYQPTPLK